MSYILDNKSKQSCLHDLENNTKQASYWCVSQALVELFYEMGIKYAFGVSGGGIQHFWDALQTSNIQTYHFQHESGAAFAACEAYFVDQIPVIVFATTGPGLTNSLTGLHAARWEGAKIIFISAATQLDKQGRGATQETSSYSIMQGLFTSGQLFNYASTINSKSQLQQIYRRIQTGMESNPQGFVVHLSIPMDIQPASIPRNHIVLARVDITTASCSEIDVQRCADILLEGQFAILVGFGARNAWTLIRELAEYTKVAVMCTPRGKGIFPEDHPQFVGVTGFAGHDSVLLHMKTIQPLHILVLGSSLGEPSTFWTEDLLPKNGFIHVDINADVPGCAYESAKTFSIQSDINQFVSQLLKILQNNTNYQWQGIRVREGDPYFQPQGQAYPYSHQVIQFEPLQEEALVRPPVLMKCIQEIAIDEHDLNIMAESGNSFAWAIHYLKFSKPNKFRVSLGFGSMGHFTTGVVGTALALEKKAIAVVGDGAMLMQHEVNTAVKYNIQAVWIILNDGQYNMCKQGAQLRGYNEQDTRIACVDFVEYGRALGAEGLLVSKEGDIKPVLKKALALEGPVVVDVRIDASVIAPIFGRVKSLQVKAT